MAKVVYGLPGSPQRVVYGWPVVVFGWLPLLTCPLLFNDRFHWS